MLSINTDDELYKLMRHKLIFTDGSKNLPTQSNAAVPVRDIPTPIVLPLNYRTANVNQQTRNASQKDEALRPSPITPQRPHSAGIGNQLLRNASPENEARRPLFIRRPQTPFSEETGNQLLQNASQGNEVLRSDGNINQPTQIVPQRHGTKRSAPSMQSSGRGLQCTQNALERNQQSNRRFQRGYRGNRNFNQRSNYQYDTEERRATGSEEEGGIQRTQNVLERNQQSNRQFQRGHRGNRHFNQRSNFQYGTEERRAAGSEGARYNNRGRSQTNAVFIPQKRLGFKKIEELFNRDPEDILVALSKEQVALYALLTEDPTGDYIVMVIRLLSKMCEASYHELKTQVLLSSVEEKFVQNIVNFIFNASIADSREKQRSHHFWDDPAEFFKHLFQLCKYMLDLLPTHAFDKLSKMLKTIEKNIENLRNNGVDFTSELLQSFDEVQEKFAFVAAEIETRNKAVETQLLNSGGAGIDESTLHPPEDFRILPVVPMMNELLNYDKPFLRKNVIQGAYRSAEHYLDVQFRLLREDFIGPLRKSIKNYLDPAYTKHVENVKVHKKVQFVEKYNNKKTFGILLQFNFSKKFRFNENSKRLIYGSLLCFTNDNFKSIIFGKVIEREKEMLKDGFIVVDLYDRKDYEIGRDYVMLECSIFFEPYYQVLNALQKFDVNAFPLSEYLLYMSTTRSLPNYLRNPEAEIIKLHNIEFPIHDQIQWPSAARLKLNDSQYEGFRNALTRKMVVIQGPPGTGKTYLGLQIARTLLLNSENWRKPGPMLVVCYTNHALDQFLEGIAKTTQDIIRIGGQSRNESMNKFNIVNVRKTVKVDMAARNLFYDKRREVEEILSDINKCIQYIKAIKDYQGVVKIENLRELDPEVRGTFLAHFSGSKLSDWLLETVKTDVIVSTQMEKEGGVNDDDLSSDDGNIVDIDYGDNPENMPTKVYEIKHDAVLKTIHYLELDLARIDQNELQHELRLQINYNTILREIQKLRDMSQFMQYWLELGKRGNYERKPQQWRVYNENTMPMNLRWSLYFHWLHLCDIKFKSKLERLEINHRQIEKNYNEARDMVDLKVMRSVMVVGMTTTGAARMHATLRALHCPVVIVEEAAEVLEAHVVVCLTQHCDQLILIGDHLQLRPSTSNYNLEKNYNLGISMFERMIMNGMHCDLLNIQHRMRPEISALISPNIYPNLKNAESVTLYPPIVGVQASLYFINHTHSENSDEDSVSKTNDFEANYLIRLAEYLVLNGYAAEDITIIAAYSAQMFLLREVRRTHARLKYVKITVLDNYQGEENKIILLSLVRNNTNNSVGFLKIENRVCVALSRAKEGMYVMGNMDLLCNNSEIWPKVKGVLEEQGALGPSLALVCREHNTTTRVETIEDFAKVPEGGCNRPCEKPLVCGHVCTKMCHAYDKDHLEYVCTQKCNRVLCELNHLCDDICGRPCGSCKVLVEKELPCGHSATIQCFVAPELHKCMVWLKKTLACEHEVDAPCYSDPTTYRCPVMCDGRIEPCGHACQLTCHKFIDPDHLQYQCTKPCAKLRAGCQKDHECQKLCYQDCDPCIVNVKKHRTVCTHVFTIACKDDVDLLVCEKPCSRLLGCGHKCKNKCNETCGPCKEKVDKSLSVCNHMVKALCSEEPDRKYCKNKCPLLLACGHPCTKRCNEPCTPKCKVFIDSSRDFACGHRFKIPCHFKNASSEDLEVLQHCTQPCGAKLKCNHSCSGTCGKCYQGRVHVSCMEKCGSVLACGHECTTPCREACRPCQQNCIYKCKHSKCTKKCGQPCTKCSEPCTRRCPHVRCTKKCGEICNVPPCTEPCQKTLECGHECIGYCGDKCPPLCRVCDFEELTEFFLGNEDEEDARFVYLEECGHTIESSGMEQWLQVQDSDESQEIRAAYCPRCKSVITTNQRYSNYVKNNCANLTLIKLKSFGEQNQMKKRKEAFLGKTYTVLETYSDIFKKEKHLKEILTMLASSLKESDQKGKRQYVDKMKIDTVQAKLDLLVEILKVRKQYEVKTPQPIAWSQQYLKYLNTLLTRNEYVIMMQETSDINFEISKYNRIMQYLVASEKIPENEMSRPEVSQIVAKFKKLVVSVAKYDDAMDLVYKNDLLTLSKIFHSPLNITDREKKEIVGAMGFSRGHWYKCPKGHVYCIDACGGATQVGKCNECGSQIGGSGHRLLSSNAVATEMDGATHSAFSEHYNDMRNFRL